MEQMNSIDVFDSTMEGLKAGLKVLHIATRDLIACSANDLAVEVLCDSRYLDFDQIPVKQAHQVVGVLLRGHNAAPGPVIDSMYPLSESLLVSAHTPLADFLSLIQKDLGTDVPYRLVVEGGSIKGIVTLSDLLKLPVRLLGFAATTHLEMLMAQTISINFSDEQWQSMLSPGRRANLGVNWDNPLCQYQ